MKSKLGCVPFLNAKPLIALFSDDEDQAIEVTFANPSLLGGMIDSGAVDAAIASSYFAIADPTLNVAAAVSISSRQAVESVRMFSKVPFGEIRSIALDQASMTSNHLALVVLSEAHGVRPRTERREAALEAMLGSADAAVLIGDAGMSANARDLHVMDLGQEWKNMTGLPFVWALWVGRDGLNQELASTLRRAKDYGLLHVEEIAQRAAKEMRWEYEKCFDYLTNSIDYDLSDEHLKGFELFGRKCVEMGFVGSFSMPTIIGDACANSTSS